VQLGEILHVGPYKIQLAEVHEDATVTVRAIFQPNMLRKQAATETIPTEKYLKLRELMLSWEACTPEERINIIMQNGFDPISELRR